MKRHEVSGHASMIRRKRCAASRYSWHCVIVRRITGSLGLVDCTKRHPQAALPWRAPRYAPTSQGHGQ